ncbi:hypothetical protein QJS10_CPB04g00673 [Acorus calamus]|uniref:Uncharacterized protein n=1 Tax=Acorus calamus TaxID=4465 RepID=A0AAV9EZB8_ACOCL|nr:hypothetical protein QJS10_CPB04g00673 [Acorus calamus]
MLLRGSDDDNESGSKPLMRIESPMRVAGMNQLTMQFNKAVATACFDNCCVHACWVF